MDGINVYYDQHGLAFMFTDDGDRDWRIGDSAPVDGDYTVENVFGDLYFLRNNVKDVVASLIEETNGTN
tara:strand:- start:1204 stop:1410 length:207 start_codon:yes stop_codon:yes gene_type:complete